MNFSSLIQKLSQRQSLLAPEMEFSMGEILSEKLSENDVITFLTLLRDKGETSEEIFGAVNVLRKKMTRVACQSSPLIDVCGTGGDAKNTFNISTAVSFILAACGLHVAKHGNRAVSSQSGSADVLKALGVNVEVSPEVVAHCIDKVGVGFLFAPNYHPALKTVGPIRKKIGTRTIFNILGPLLNPSCPAYQVVGVYDAKLLKIVAEVLQKSGIKKAAVVHGNDGLDEVTLTTTTKIVFVDSQKITEEIFDPKSVGYDYCLLSDFEGKDPEFNAKRLRQVLKGHSMPLDHCVHLNAALGLIVAEKTDSMKEALLMVQEAISSGKAYQKLEQLVEMTNS